MNNLSKKILSPKIRFKGFNDEYKVFKLNNYIIERNEKIKYKNIELASVGKLGFRLKKDVFKNGINVLETHSCKIVYPNDFVLGMGTKQIDFILNNLNRKFGVSIAYYIYKVLDNLNAYYLNYLIIKNLLSLSSKFLIISTRQGKNVDKIGFLNHIFYMPSLNEQNKIAKFFELIDRKIELLDKEKELFEKKKKYYLNNMFCNNDELLPKIRFKGFIDKWKKSTLLNELELIPGKWPNNLKLYETNNTNDVPYPIQSNLIDGYINTFNKFFKRENINLMNYYNEKNLVISATCNIGHTGWVLLKEYVIDDKFFIIKSTNDIRYIKYLLDSLRREVLKSSQGTSIMKVNKNIILNINVLIPSLLEQNKIAKFFELIDNKIELINKEKELFEKKKKYYLNNMFCNI